MPSVVYKAQVFSRRTHIRTQSAKLIHKFPRFIFPFATGLGYRFTDMPEARKTREKQSFEQPHQPPGATHKKQKATGSSKEKDVLTLDEARTEGKSSSTPSPETSIAIRDQKRSGVAHHVSATAELDTASKKLGSVVRNLTVAPTPQLQARLNEQVRLRKKQIVIKLMAVVSECLDKQLAPFEEPCDGEGCSSRSQPPSSSKSGQSKRRLAGQKRQHQPRDEEDGNESGNDDDDQRNRNGKRTKTSQSGDKPKLACPYYKYDQAKFGQKRTCCGPGWEDSHRLKEHLMRAHALGDFQCARCLQLFKTKDNLTDHQRAIEVCQVKNPSAHPRDLADGFDKAQKEKLLKRTRKPGHDKWIEWYCILFDKDPLATDIPSPYYGVPDNVDWRAGHTGRCANEGYTTWMRQGIMSRIEVQLELELEKAMNGVEHNVKRNVISMIPSIAMSLNRVLQSDPSSQGAAAASSTAATKIEDLADCPVIPPELTNYTDMFAGIEVDFEQAVMPEDGFDFTTLQDDPTTDTSSDSSCFSNGNLAGSTSDTSAEEEAAAKVSLPDALDPALLYSAFLAPTSDPYTSYIDD